MKYYTADLHFGHARIIDLCKRPFKDTTVMEEVLVEHWNQVVNDDDEVYLLGDIFWHYEGNHAALLRRLKGKKYLVLGNHDGEWLKNAAARQEFILIAEEMLITDNGLNLCLKHVPDLNWTERNQGRLLLFGHLHNNYADPLFAQLAATEAAFCACVELHDYQPVTLADVIKNSQQFYQTWGLT